MRYGLVSFAGMAPNFPVAVTTSMDGASAAVMDLIPDLRLIACNGAGLDRIDMAEAERRGIAVVNTADAVTADTAEFAIALTFALGRKVVEADRFARSGRWSTSRMNAGKRVAGRTLGIVGMGKVGTSIAEKAAPLGMNVRYTSRRQKTGLSYPFDPDIRTLAGNSDILVVAVSGGAETRGLVDAGVLSCLGPEGLLINISRGSVVDVDALVDALGAHAIAGAALDVFVDEPAIDPRLVAFENVIVTPHIAAATTETRLEMAEQLTRAIDEFFDGRRAR